MESNLERKEDLEILNWLTPIDYATQQSDYIRRQQPGTGQWLLESAEYQAWLNESKQTLFCPGIPGAGKTILTSVVVDNLLVRFQDIATVRIAYLYCAARNEQNIDDLLANLLKQLAQGQSPLPNSVKKLYDRHQGQRMRPSLDEISRALHSVAEKYSRVFIIVDALDECRISDVRWKKFLDKIFSLQAKTRASLFATSRFIPEIAEKFSGSTSLEIRANSHDVRRYLEGHMYQLPGFVARRQELQEEIKSEIIQSVDGMCVASYFRT
jgi:Cdc6-like AAA superfamily ATPase